MKFYESNNSILHLNKTEHSYKSIEDEVSENIQNTTMEENKK